MSTLTRKTPLKRTGFSPASHKSDIKSGKKSLKSRGMKGRTTTKEERELHDRIARIGCIACLLDGRFNDLVSIHHIDGRTKPGAHKKVLPLCAEHHQQDDADPLGRIAVHPNKARFEELYGSQYRLLEFVMKRIGEA
jgi:hypothetical protein